MKQNLSKSKSLLPFKKSNRSVFLKQISVLHLKISELMNENIELKKNKGMVKQESLFKLTPKISNKIIGFSPPIEKKSL